MIHDTTYRGKATAVLFAAIMVVSAVAVGFAVAPAAAAAPGDAATPVAASIQGQDVPFQTGDADDYDVDRFYTNGGTDLQGDLLWQGQTVGVTGLDADADVSLRESRDGDTDFVEELRTDGSGTVVFDTEDLDAGDYYLDGTGADMSPSETFEVAVQDLDTAFDEQSVQSDDDAELEIESNRGSYDVNVSADGDLDDDELEQLFEGEFDVSNVDDDDEITLEGVTDGTFDAEFSDVDDLSTGEYEFSFDVTDTSAADTASISVTEAGEGDLSLADGTTTVAQGDVAEVTVELDDTDSGSVVIGDFEENNYQANISVEDGNDDGEVTVLFNTYAAGR
ncbi:hypothetical protein DJ75_17795, partial [Halorubrum sp. Eb13]